VYGTTNVTNNEFYLWFVNGYIAQEKNEIVNWTKATISRARKKARREEVRVMTSVRSVNLTMLGGGEASNGVKRIFVWNSQLAKK
jgi:hypothetical protein